MTKTLRSFTSLIAATFVCTPSLVLAQSDRCIATLITDARSHSVNTAAAFAMNDLVNSMTSSEDKQKASIGLPTEVGIIELGGSRARKLASQFARETNIRWNQATSVQAVSSTLSANAVEAYRICVDGQHTSGPRIYVHDATPTQATVKIAWSRPAKAPTTATASILVTGGSPQQPFPASWDTGDDFSVVVDRLPRQDLRIVANIGGGTDDVTVPYLPLVTIRRTSEVVEEPAAPKFSRLANDGTGRNQGPSSGCYEPSDDGVIGHGSGSVEMLAFAGNLDSTSYVEITSQDEERVCWKAFLRPLSRSGGGDMQWRIKYRIDRVIFAVQ